MDALDSPDNQFIGRSILDAHPDRHPIMRFICRVCLGDLGYGAPIIPGGRFDSQRCYRLAMGEYWRTCADLLGSRVHRNRLCYQSSSSGVFDAGIWGALFDRWSIVPGKSMVTEGCSEPLKIYFGYMMETDFDNCFLKACLMVF